MGMIFNMKLADNIKLYRKQIGLTQKKLASYLNASGTMISNYEVGYSTPDVTTLIKLADIFEVTLDELVGREFNIKTTVIQKKK